MRAPPPHRPRLAHALRRPGAAVVAALVWLLGVELGPGLHIARHGALGHHHHGAGEALACEPHHGEGAREAHAHHHAVAHHRGHEPHAVAHHDGHEPHAVAHHRGHEPHAVAHHRGHEPHAVAGHAVAPHEHLAVGGHHEEHAAADHHGHPAVGHAHDPGEAEPSDPTPQEAEPPEARDHAPGPVPHGAGSLAHRDLVPLTPPVALPPILSAPWRPVVVVSVVRIAPRERTPTVLRARGPPCGHATPTPLSLA